MQRVQNFAARVAVGGVKKYDHISPFIRELKWLKVKQKHVFQVGVTIFKALRGVYPDLFLSLSSRQAVTSSITRQRHSLYVPRTKTQRRQAHCCTGSQAMEHVSTLPHPRTLS